MLAWISGNIITIIICAALLAAVTAIIAGMVRNKRKGKSSCGCGCRDCPMSTSCHPGNHAPASDRSSGALRKSRKKFE